MDFIEKIFQLCFEEWGLFVLFKLQNKFLCNWILHMEKENLM